MRRGIDHLVLATRDLESQADVYRRLGFTVGARNRHPWGTLNHIVQFPGCFLELISIEPGFQRPAPDEPVAQFATFLADFLDQREGLAMLVLESQDAKADHADFAAKGIGKGETFTFARKGRRPDGSEVELGFTLAFATSPAIPGQGFFVCQHHFPENFWNAEFQRHANAVSGVSAVVMVAADPNEHLAFLQAFAGAGTSHRISTGWAIETGRGRIEVVTEAGLRALVGSGGGVLDTGGPAFAAVRFASRDLAATRAALEKGRVPLTELHGRLVVGAPAAHGVAFVFEADQ